MYNTPKIRLALAVCVLAHKDQKRKLNGLPYIVHPVSVMNILAEFTDTEGVLTAALLHDVLEDQPDLFSEAELEHWFGIDVMDSVHVVTKDSSINDWRARNEKYLRTLRDSNDMWAAMVCASDKINNLSDILENYELSGDEIWDSFNAGPEDQYWWYSSVAKQMNKIMPGHGLALQLDALVDQFARLMYDRDGKRLEQILLASD